MNGVEWVLGIVILILIGDGIFIRLDLKDLEERLDNHKEIMNIQNQKTNDVWEYVKKL